MFIGPLIQWHRVRLIEHSHVESSKSREETLAGSFMGAASRVHTITNARPLHVVYTTHIRILRSRISRYPDPEVGNLILLSTLEFAQHLSRASTRIRHIHR